MIQNLQIALEVCVREFIIRPVASQFALGQGVKIRSKGEYTLFPVGIRPDGLNLGEMARLLEDKQIVDIIKQLIHDTNDVNFVRIDLATECKRLWRDRNPTAHPPYSVEYNKMASHRDTIIGINEPGILYRLLKIARVNKLLLQK